jgi:Ca2+-binding EF-hand superfamily protein
MAKIDKDGDGRVSRNEAAGSPFAQRFDRLDTNRDGYVTREEMRAAFQQMRDARAKAPAAR